MLKLATVRDDTSSSASHQPMEQFGHLRHLGEVFTRRWVADLILDLVGYTADRDLGALLAVEPACGEGAFLGPMIARLIASASAHGRRLDDLAGALRALDLSDLNVERARKIAVTSLADAGCDMETAEALARTWVVQGDFLLDTPVQAADFVIGNPPYIRLEHVPAARTAAYRQACPTMRGRSDVYVGFIERGLRLLSDDGVLGFIVADRWMHNQYGSDLRKLIVEGYSVETVIEMHDVDAFEGDVSAYPAVIVIRRRAQAPAALVTTDASFGPRAATRLDSWIQRGRSRAVERRGFRGARLASWFPGDELWPSGDPQRLAVLSDLERRFPALDDATTGTKVGIGVATGGDEVYITSDRGSIEDDRLLPLVLASDITTGRVAWSGSCLVNPWDGGRLVDITEYPGMRAYFQGHESALRARHIAGRHPETWYRTIDRVSPGLLQRPKLLLPDLKAASHPVLDDGNYYPHHNLYYVISDTWDLEVLGGLLLSNIANLFVGAYCVKMRGGCYRFQAQYLRKIRVPHPGAVPAQARRRLARAFADRDGEAATSVAMKVYGIDELPGV